MVRNEDRCCVSGRFFHFLVDDVRPPALPEVSKVYITAFTPPPDRGVALGVIEPFDVPAKGEHEMGCMP